MGKSQRTKGHDFERKIASRFRELWESAKRGFQTRGGTSEAPDVDGTPFFIECKKGKRTNIKAAYRQALGATDGRVPIAVTQDDREEILVTLSLTHFLLLIRSIFWKNGEFTYNE